MLTFMQIKRGLKQKFGRDDRERRDGELLLKLSEVSKDQWVLKFLELIPIKSPQIFFFYGLDQI